MNISCPINGALSTNKNIIQFLYLLKIHHYPFKVSPMNVFKAFWSYSSSNLVFSISINNINFSQVFSAFLPGVCVAFCLIHLTLAVANKSGTIILSCLEPFCQRGMVTKSRKIRFKWPNSSVHWNIFCFPIRKKSPDQEAAYWLGQSSNLLS